MEYVLIDSNIMLDILLQRDNADEATEAYAKVLKAGKTCLISASEITDIYYICNRLYKDPEMAHDVSSGILHICKIADVLASDIRRAFDSPMKDFEDAVVASVAQRYNASFILTNNIKDYTNSPIPAKTPKQVLKEKWVLKYGK